MFARKVAVRLKPGALKEFATLMESQILPWLRKQEGFLDLMTLAAPDESEVATISFWDHELNAQAYDASGYPEVVNILEELLDGIPYVKTFEVAGSTFHRVAPAHQSETQSMVGENGPAQPGYRSYETNV